MRKAAVLAACLIAPVVWAGECKMQPTTIPVHVVQNRVVAIVKINGQELPMMVATTAQFSVLLPEPAKALKLPLAMLPFGMHLSGNGENIEAHTTVVNRLGFGNVEVEKVSFVVTEANLGLNLQGILGRNVLAAGDTEYDLARGVVRLVFPQGDCDKASLAYWAGDAPVIETPMSPARDDRDTMVRVPIRINDKPVTAILSTGAQHTTLSTGAARKAGIARDRWQPMSSGTPGEPTRRWLTDIDSFQLGGERITDQRLEVEDFASEGDFDVMLGVDYLLAHRVYVSYHQRRVYATWNGGDVFTAREGAAKNQFDTKFAAVPATPQQDEADLLVRRGTLAVAAKDFALAVELMDRAIAHRPDVAMQYQIRAQGRYGIGQRAGALRDADEALRLDPSLSQARLTRVHVLVRDNQPDEALAELARLDASLSRDADERYLMAWTYNLMGRVPEADQQWASWISTHPRDVKLGHAYNERCFMRTTRKLELPLALKDCERAVEVNAKSSAFQDSLGWTLLRLGDLPRAKAAFDAAIALEPGHPWALYGRSLYWRKMDDQPRARQDLAAARKSLPSIDDQIRDSGLPTLAGEL
ncbi:aspartyl protease family protein [Roseateles sp. So40a]|uniref:aspartyl protease family protein n=1 Tax=Roseateles sp. So40a TaxID=3400226 RepID=UPI003A86C251